MATAVFQTVIRPRTVAFASQILPPGFNPRSLLVVSTPQNTPALLEAVMALQREKPQIQVVAAACDSIAPNHTRNGLSTAWFDQYMTVGLAVRLEERDDLHTAPGESDGVNPVSAKKHWKVIESSFKVGLPFLGGVKHEFGVPLANTVFHNSNLLTLFYLQPAALDPSHTNSGHLLADLSVTLPAMASTASHGVIGSDNLEPLYGLADGLVITDSNANLIKTINGQSASGYLENCAKLMDLASKETEVFVRVHSPAALGAGGYLQFKVIAGGGGWGAKANILAVLPEARLVPGQRVEFFMLKPDVRFLKPEAAVASGHHPLQVALECSYEEQGYQAADEEGPEVILKGVFGCGSELGFTLDGVRHNSAGQSIRLRI